MQNSSSTLMDTEQSWAVFLHKILQIILFYLINLKAHSPQILMGWQWSPVGSFSFSFLMLWFTACLCGTQTQLPNVFMQLVSLISWITNYNKILYFNKYIFLYDSLLIYLANLLLENFLCNRSNDFQILGDISTEWLPNILVGLTDLLTGQERRH